MEGNMRRTVVLTTLFVFVGTTAALTQVLTPRGNERPSFDCAKATSGAATLICSDGELAKYDSDLSAVYQKKYRALSADAQGRFRDEEIAWIRNRNQACGLAAMKGMALEQLVPAKPCMIKWFSERIRELENATIQPAGVVEPMRPQVTENLTTAWQGGSIYSNLKQLLIIELSKQRSEPVDVKLLDRVQGEIPQCMANGHAIADLPSSLMMGRWYVFALMRTETVDKAVVLNTGRVSTFFKYMYQKARTSCDTGSLKGTGQSAPAAMMIVVANNHWYGANKRGLEAEHHTPRGDLVAWTIDGDHWEALGPISDMANEQTAQARIDGERARTAAEAERQAARNAEIQRKVAATMDAIKAANPQNPADNEFVQPVIDFFMGRRQALGPATIACADEYTYAGGTVVGKSIDGTLGIILMNLNVIGKSETVIGRNSIVSSVCGAANVDLAAATSGIVQIKAAFRKYDSGWRFERLLEQ